MFLTTIAALLAHFLYWWYTRHRKVARRDALILFPDSACHTSQVDFAHAEAVHMMHNIRLGFHVRLCPHLQSLLFVYVCLLLNIHMYVRVYMYMYICMYVHILWCSSHMYYREGVAFLSPLSVLVCYTHVFPCTSCAALSCSVGRTSNFMQIQSVFFTEQNFRIQYYGVLRRPSAHTCTC